MEERGEQPEPPFTLLDMAVAFDGAPNRASPEVLSLYLTFKCLDGTCGISTAESIRAALKAMWDAQ